MTHTFLRKPYLLLVLGLLLSAAAGAVSAQTVLEQIHALAFTADGKGIIVPTSGGLMTYREGRWKNLQDAPPEFTSFSLTRNAAYGSERRAPDSTPSDAPGLMKSTDGGLTWKPLAASGEADFRLMAAGFRSNAVYLITTAPNSRMPQPGLYHTQDDGKTWQSAAARALPARVTSIAVHPTDPRTVAIGTPDGLYVSRDSGATFKLLPGGKAVTAVLFDVGGEHVYIAREGVDAVDRASLDAESARSLALPIASHDFVTYIAQNPARPHELAVATSLHSVFVSTNGGGTWRAIAREGRPA